MATHQLPPLTAVDSSFVSDQQNDQYVIREEEKTAVRHCEAPAGKSLQADVCLYKASAKLWLYR
jgi:hypothetical protein